MGSFNATCIISGLPIEAGDPVRFFLLTSSKYRRGNEHICYVSGRWQLRGAAIRAKYNDYGSIEDLEESLTTRALFEALNVDAVEQGVGDNQCHDVQVRHGMPEEDWLKALWEGRVFVRDATLRFQPGAKRAEPEEGLPSLSQVEAVLKEAGLKVTTAWGAHGYCIDEVSRGFVRVRYERQASTREPSQKTAREDLLENLEKILPLMHAAGYAAMITCGTGNYAQQAEVLVAPKPAPLGKSYFVQGLQEEASTDVPRPVSQVMVREDVWQILLRTKLETWYINCGLERMKEDALLWLAKTQEDLRGPPHLAALSDLQDHDNLFANNIRPGEGTSGYSLRAAFKFGIQISNNDAELRQYVLDLAEMAYVQLIYGGLLHGQWHPSTNSGQEPGWEDHRAFLQELLKIRGAYEDDDEEEEEDDENEEDE